MRGIVSVSRDGGYTFPVVGMNDRFTVALATERDIRAQARKLAGNRAFQVELFTDDDWNLHRPAFKTITVSVIDHQFNQP